MQSCCFANQTYMYYIFAVLIAVAIVIGFELPDPVIWGVPLLSLLPSPYFVSFVLFD